MTKTTYFIVLLRTYAQNSDHEYVEKHGNDRYRPST